MCVVLEYMCTDLKNLIISKLHLTDAHIKCIMKQLLEGIEYSLDVCVVCLNVSIKAISGPVSTRQHKTP